MLQNQVTLIGHLGADLKAFRSAKGEAVASGRLAVSNRYTDRNGNVVDDTQWFNLVGFGRRAERLLRDLRRGDRVCIGGRLSVSRYETKAGETREGVQIVVTSFELLPGLAERKAALAELVAAASESAHRDSILDGDQTLATPEESPATRVVALGSARATDAKAKAKAKSKPARSLKVAA